MLWGSLKRIAGINPNRKNEVAGRMRARLAVPSDWWGHIVRGMSKQTKNSMSLEEIMDRMREGVRLGREARAQGAMPHASPFGTAHQEGSAATGSLHDLSELRRNVAATYAQWNQVGVLNPRRPGLHNKLIQLFKKALARILSWYTRPLLEFHASVTRSLQESMRSIENLQYNAVLTLQQINDLGHRFETLQTSLSGFAQRVDTLALMDQFRSSRVEERLLSNERNIRRLAHFPGETQFDYFLFERRFRGSEEEIRNRQKAYLEHFRGRENVVDLGCGRGEFLELMRENTVSARGVESNTDMFLYCKEKGLDVIQENLFTYLESVQDGSIGGIFCSQVIEHLPSNLQIRLASLCSTKLKSGSPLVIETINPECLFALSRNFFLDPTHVRPVPAEMLRFLLECLHFKDVEIRFSSRVHSGQDIPILSLPQPSPDLERFNQALQRMDAILFGYQDYAALAHR